MTVINTSTAATSSAYSNQRKVDRCQNGVLHSAWKTDDGAAGQWQFHYSTDDGATWAQAGWFYSGPNGSGTAHTSNLSFFIDLDDYAHVAYKDRGDGYIYYRRGTPNAARTAWTWSATTTVYGAASGDYPDIVAHREGAGWRAHIGWAVGSSVRYERLAIDSGGTVTVEANDAVLGSAYAGSVGASVSLDFNHTGDGKTVAGGTPHLYAAWSAGAAGAAGAGNGIRFKKATYSGGSWTWGTEREIDSTRYISSENYWLNCLFDGTRVILAGYLYQGSSNIDLMLYERDVADTTTTTRTLVENEAVASGLIRGSASYAGNGDVYLFGVNGDVSPYEVQYRKWTRATATLGAITVLDADTTSRGWLSAKRGFSNSSIEFIYTDGTASPYSVTYGSISLFTAATVNWWDGTAWTAKPLKRWDGTDWVTVEASKFKHWDGTAWTQV